jgi:hypothetical protein
MGEDPHSELSRLLTELEALRASFNALQLNEIPAYRDYVEALESERNRRLARVDEFYEQQVQGAQQAYAGALHMSEHNYEHSVASLSDRIHQLIQLKFSVLAEEMPEPVRYFQMRAHETEGPFGREFGSSQGDAAVLDDQTLNGKNDEGVLSEAELARALEAVAENRTEYEIREGALWIRGGATFQIGRRVMLTVGAAGRKYGVLQAVNRNGIDVLTDKGQVVKVPLLSLNLGITSIDKYT